VPHIYKYCIGPTPKSVEYHLFRQFLKFTELPRQFLPDMSDLWTGHVRLRSRTCPGIGVPVYIRGLSAPPLNPNSCFSSTPSLAVTKGSSGDFGSSPPNPFGFLEI
jgi:hypothetical protein